MTGAVAQCGYFKHSVLNDLVNQHVAGRSDHSTVLWSLLMLDAFLRRDSAFTAVKGDTTSGIRRMVGKGVA